MLRMMELYRPQRFLLPSSGVSGKNEEKNNGSIRFALAAWSPDPDPVADLGVRRIALTVLASQTWRVPAGA